MGGEWKPVTLYRVGNESGGWVLHTCPALQSRWQWRFPERAEANGNLLIANRSEEWRGFRHTPKEAIQYRLLRLSHERRAYPDREERLAGEMAQLIRLLEGREDADAH